ncbi:MAG: hypothetical protein ACREKH_20225, partial [Candidatus Rokuibacteriota bacterium]
MLTGRATFRGETISDTIAAILGREPDWSALPGTTPASVRRLLLRCLDKDAARRFRDVGDARHEIEETLAALRARGTNRVRIAVMAAGALALVAIGATLWTRSVTRPADALAEAESSFASARFDQLTNQPGEEYFPSLSPDGRSLVYASRAAGNWDIFVQRVGGQNRVNLTNDSEADDTQPALSPTGDYIAFRSDRDGGGIFVMGATGESVRRLTDFGYDPAWSPDGTELVFSSVGFDIPGARASVGELWRVQMSTGEVRPVKTDVGDAVQASWSPHGSRLAFWSVRSTRAAVGERDVWTVDASGGTATRVTDDAALDWNPVWSPDGQYLYFASDRGGSMNFWRVRIDEATGKVLDEPRPVTRGGGAATRQSLSFSRDGRRMAFVERVARSNVQRLAFDSRREASLGRPEWITQGSRQTTTPSPSPDGGWVLFSSTGAPQEDIFIVRPDGTGERRLTND